MVLDTQGVDAPNPPEMKVMRYSLCKNPVLESCAIGCVCQLLLVSVGVAVACLLL